MDVKQPIKSMRCNTLILLVIIVLAPLFLALALLAVLLFGAVADTAREGWTLLAGGLAIGAEQQLLLLTLMVLLFFLAHGVPAIKGGMLVFGS